MKLAFHQKNHKKYFREGANDQQRQHNAVALFTISVVNQP
jgi:hypothetical protein